MEGRLEVAVLSYPELFESQILNITILLHLKIILISTATLAHITQLIQSLPRDKKPIPLFFFSCQQNRQ